MFTRLPFQRSHAVFRLELQPGPRHVQGGDPRRGPPRLLAPGPGHQQALRFAAEQSPSGEPQTGAALLPAASGPGGARGAVHRWPLVFTTSSHGLLPPTVFPPAPVAVPTPSVAVLGSVHLLLFVRLFAPEAPIPAPPESARCPLGRGGLPVPGFPLLLVLPPGKVIVLPMGVVAHRRRPDQLSRCMFPSVEAFPF